jgi:hypothetical protein
MFRKKCKILLIAFMFGLIFVSSNVTRVQAQAQVDNFPIGLYIVYTVDQDHDIYNIRYDFREWVNRETLLIEYELDDVTYIEHLYEIHLDGHEHPPIWLDPSLFETQSIFTFSGYPYHYVGIETHWVPGIEEDCFRIEYSITDGSMENWSILYYHCETGIMVDYIHAAFYEPGVERAGYMNEIYGTNLDEFNPLTITIPETGTTTTSSPTTTSPTSTTTSYQQTSTPPNNPTTSSISTGNLQITSLSPVLGFGVVVEIIVIIFILQRRDGI